MMEKSNFEYVENGELKEKVFYTKGKKDGIATKYFENGQVAFSEIYKEGLLLEGVYYDRDKNVISRIKNILNDTLQRSY